MHIYVPGRGHIDMEAFRVNKAVNDYDQRLVFGRNEQTGDWCIFVEMPRPEPPYPVIGFGAQIPSSEEALRKVQAADTMRHGWKIYDEIVKSQDDYKKKFRVAGDEARDESVEVVEHFMRKHGKSPIVKVFMNNASKEVANNDA